MMKVMPTSLGDLLANDWSLRARRIIIVCLLTSHWDNSSGLSQFQSSLWNLQRPVWGLHCHFHPLAQSCSLHSPQVYLSRASSNNVVFSRASSNNVVNVHISSLLCFSGNPVCDSHLKFYWSDKEFMCIFYRNNYLVLIVIVTDFSIILVLLEMLFLPPKWDLAWISSFLKRQLKVFSIPPSVWLFPGFPGGSDGEESTLQCGRPRFNPWVGKIPLEEGMAAHSSILAWRTPWTEEPGGYSPCGHKESDMTEAT